jgi:hypothetical protein
MDDWLDTGAATEGAISNGEGREEPGQKAGDQEACHLAALDTDNCHADRFLNDAVDLKGRTRLVKRR